MRFFEMSADGSAADVVLLGKLGCSLFVAGVMMPEIVGVKAFAAIEILATIFAFVLLSAVVWAVLFDVS